jgi:hypothetical protein
MRRRNDKAVISGELNTIIILIQSTEEIIFMSSSFISCQTGMQKLSCR